jgi:hypothetical protein
MFIVVFLLLGLAFGYAAGWPWGLLAFIVPLGLLAVASDRTAGSIILVFAITAIGLFAGFLLAARESQRHAT